MQGQGVPSGVFEHLISSTSVALLDTMDDYAHRVPDQAANAVGAVPHQALQSRAQGWKVAALATAFLLSVVLGNVALRWIPVSFAQVSERAAWAPPPDEPVSVHRLCAVTPLIRSNG